MLTARVEPFLWAGVLLLHLLSHPAHDLDKDKVKAVFQTEEINCCPALMGPALSSLTLSYLPALAPAPVTPMHPALFVRRLGTASASASLCNTPGRITSPWNAREKRKTKPIVLALALLLNRPQDLSLLPLLLPMLSPLPLRMLRTSSNVQEMQVFVPVIHVISSLPFSSMLMSIGMQTQVPCLIWPLIATGCTTISLIMCQSS